MAQYYPFCLSCAYGVPLNLRNHTHCHIEEIVVMTDRQTERQAGRQTDRRTDGRTGGWAGGRADGRTDRCTSGQTNTCIRLTCKHRFTGKYQNMSY